VRKLQLAGKRLLEPFRADSNFLLTLLSLYKKIVKCLNEGNYNHSRQEYTFYSILDDEVIPFVAAKWLQPADIFRRRWHVLLEEESGSLVFPSGAITALPAKGVSRSVEPDSDLKKPGIVNFGVNQ
jgi:hypothetical protein